MCIIFRIILDGQHILILYYYVIWNMHVKYGLDVQTKAQKKLEKLQLVAARIVAGLIMLASRDSLYYEIGCKTLID